jgi:hypothetical protein
MMDEPTRPGQRALRLALIGLALTAVEGLAMAVPALAALLCPLIPAAATLEILALGYGIADGQTRDGKLAISIACLSVGLLAMILPWLLTTHNIGP